MKLFTSLFLTFFATHSWADGISAPTDFESTSVLPHKIRNVKMLTFTTQVLSKYDASGTKDELGKAFAKNVKFSSAYEGKSATEQELQKGYMKSWGINNPESTDLGYTSGFASARATATVPVFAYGITEKWTSAIAVPIVYSNTYVDTGFTVSQSGQQFFGHLTQDTKANKAMGGLSKFQNPVSDKMVSKGYDPLVGETKTEIGDIRWINKYLVSKNEKRAVLVKQSVTLPTGSGPDANKVLHVASGDKQWDVGAAVIADWYVGRKWTVTTHADYTAQLPDHTAKRIPETSDSPLSSDVDHRTYRDLGDFGGVGVAVKYDVAEGWTLGSGYAVQHKYGDRYRGSQFSSSRYEYLNNSTDQDMNSVLVGVNYSTVPMYRKKQFAVPLEARVNYSEVISGRNVPADSVTAFDLSVYF